MHIRSARNVAGLHVDKYHLKNLLCVFVAEIVLVTLVYIAISYDRRNNLIPDFSSYLTRRCGTK